MYLIVRQFVPLIRGFVAGNVPGQHKAAIIHVPSTKCRLLQYGASDHSKPLCLSVRICIQSQALRFLHLFSLIQPFMLLHSHNPPTSFSELP